MFRANQDNDVEPKQIRWINGGTDLVSLTIGGNDVGFGDLITLCLAKGPICNPLAEERFAKSLRTLRSSLDGLFSAMRVQAPAAVVDVLGYPNVLPPDVTVRIRMIPASVLKETELRWLRRAATRLNSVIRQRVDARRKSGDANIFFLDVAERFKGHEACTKNEWIHCVVRGGIGPQDVHDSFHPNARGHEELAAILLGDPSITRFLNAQH